MKWNKPQTPTPGPKWVLRFALLPKMCHPLWGGCGSYVWLKRTYAVRHENRNGSVYYIPICDECYKDGRGGDDE
jgi:hypothetical protein